MSELRTVGIDVSLTTEQIENLESQLNRRFKDNPLSEQLLSGMTLTKKLSGLATGALIDLASGGTLLSPEKTRAILELAGSVDEIVPLLERAKGRKHGQHLLEIELDPYWEPALAQIAELQGRTVQEVFKDAVDTCLAMNWIYEIPLGPIQLLFTAEQVREIGRVMGIENPTGRDVTDYILSREAEPVLEEA